MLSSSDQSSGRRHPAAGTPRFKNLTAVGFLQLTSLSTQKEVALPLRLLPLASLAVLAGALVGAGGPLLDSVDAGFAHALAAILSAGWCYAALALCAGLAGSTKQRAASAGGISLLAAVLAYYITKACQGDFRAVDFADKTGQTTYFSWDGFASMTAVWGVVALITGPVFGLSGWMAFRSRVRLPFQLLIPAIALSETTMRLRVEASTSSSPVVTAWEIVRNSTVLLIVVLLAYAAWAAWRSRSNTQNNG